MCVSGAGPCARPALSFLLDHLLVEVPLQPLVGQVDEELLEAVVLEALEAVDVEKADRAPAAEVAATIAAAGARTVDVEGGVHSSDDPFEESRVDGASEGITHVSRLLRRQRAHDRVRGGGGGGAVDGSILLGRRRHLWRRLGRAAGAARAEAQSIAERRRRHLQRGGGRHQLRVVVEEAERRIGVVRLRRLLEFDLAEEEDAAEGRPEQRRVFFTDADAAERGDGRGEVGAVVAARRVAARRAEVPAREGAIGHAGGPIRSAPT